MKRPILSKVLIAKLRAAVRRGARLLDEQDPNWFWGINSQHLRMESGHYCILAQRSTTFATAPVDMSEPTYSVALDGLGARLRIPEGEERFEFAAEHGFNAGRCREGFEMPVYSRLTEFWIDAIRTRRERAKVAR